MVTGALSSHSALKASGENGFHRMKLSALVLVGSEKFGFVCDFPPMEFQKLAEKQTFIAIGELLAFVLVLKSYGEILSGTPRLHHPKSYFRS